ncbi:MAG: type II secretion system protein [bacterium]
MFETSHNNRYQLVRGFTLIEAFVSMTILMIAIIGPLSLFSRAIGDANAVKNQMIGYYLAQEGLELAINKLDSNRTEGGIMVPKKDTDWLNGLDLCTSTGGCKIYYSFGNPAPAVTTDGASGDKFYITPNPDPYTNPLYSYTTLNRFQTIFSRKITISPTAAGAIPVTNALGGTDNYYSELVASSTVSWREKGISKSVTLRTIISN